ncbi:helix-turn-helix domain-containing protein [Oscillochloris sp. ZM17-4]|uniref:helix-turn-helix domain-containing protein n=1 Tax=Oscillochloris sp. ZM17-4 TaxID=2866714 RepID=UPI001C7300F4|nr:helix-turn-helix transcriptional regulator [Oscillochloris sp. ZM17-4]MBX0328351.1 helix-turn-helix domain-containing protein [Oscillochloris sp. ZM17-4]
MKDTAELRREIGARIHDARLRRTLAQGELAALVGVGRGTISRWETGTRAVPSALLSQLASALQTTVAHLTGEQAPPAGPVRTTASPQIRGEQLWPAIDQSHLHALERDTIVQIVSQLVERPELLPAVLDTILQTSLDPSTTRSQEETAAAIMRQLRGINISEITPLSALRVLADLQDLAIHGSEHL